LFLERVVSCRSFTPLTACLKNSAQFDLATVKPAKNNSINAFEMSCFPFSSVCGVLLLIFSLSSARYARDWNLRSASIIPKEELSLLPNREFPYNNFDPPLFLREDDAPFMAVAVLDSYHWISLALNSLVSLAKFHSINGVTVMTEGNEELEKIFRRLGIYAYNANDTISTFPEDFSIHNRLPNWSWGEIIFMRYNLWFEAFRRRVGFCSLDLDVTYNQDVLFSKNGGESFSDVTMQGNVLPADRYHKHKTCKTSINLLRAVA
jgi:hypothetical protein